MSNPNDQSAMFWDATPPAERQPKPGELIWEFVAVNQVRFRCELRDHGQVGVEAQFFRNGEFFSSRRFHTRALALQWAALEREALGR